MTPGVRCILLDIEGTIAPIAFVHDVLFPFARARLNAFLERHWDTPEVHAARQQIADDAHSPPLDRDALIAHLLGLMDRDAKTTGLKSLQGLIWRGGFESGELRSPLFDDVAPAIRRWREEGVRISIYSSGSAAAQRLFCAHTTAGDLTPLIERYFDTTVGAKRSAASYQRIAELLALPAEQMLFISDVPAELAAARAAGVPVRLAVRPGNAPATGTEFPALQSLSQLSAID
ncbi:Enolase-phosphatase E1 [Phycisphaerae bacterium RAS1]|nr:Enolase-phosphatase E1 [Phycisphaerae bacterium RAS1]